MSAIAKAESPLRATFRLLAAFPCSLLFLQLPTGFLELVGGALSMRHEESMVVASALFFPYNVASAISCALTFVFVHEIAAGRPASWRFAYAQITTRLGRLVPVAFLATLLCLVGMVALIVPALYFMTVFFFFPQVVASEPWLPWTVYLNRSKRIAKQAFWKTLAAVLCFLVIEIGLERISGTLGSWWGIETHPSPRARVSRWSFRCFFLW